MTTTHTTTGPRYIRTARNGIELWDVKGCDSELDGGRWQLLCVPHGGLAQDTNRKRLEGWITTPANWCPCCQDERDYGTDD